jgi:hypothetical protein
MEDKMNGETLLVRIITQIMLRTGYFLIGTGLSGFLFLRTLRWGRSYYGEEAQIPYFMVVCLFILACGIFAAMFGPMIYSADALRGRGALKEDRERSRLWKRGD